MKIIPQLMFFGLAFSLGACSKDAATTASPTIAGSLQLVQNGVAKAGAGMSNTASMTMLRSQDDNRHMLIPSLTSLSSSLCSAHGEPLMPSAEGGGYMSSSDTRYPGVATFCALTVDDGETVIGGFTLARSLICSLEQAGIQFAGATQTIALDFSNPVCWPNGAPGGGATPSGVTISAVGTAPAVFNPHYAKGVAFSVPMMGLNFKIAANIEGDKIEFIAHELWSGSNAGSSAGNTGVMAGEITKSTGVVRFEKRDERVRSDCSDSSCGFNRHTRILANVTIANGEPTGVTSFQYARGNVSINSTALGTSSDTSSMGSVITAKGTVATQIKARLFGAASKTTAQLQTPNQWTETANTTCVSHSGATTTNCSSETGIPNFASTTKFALYSSSPQTSPSAWLTAFSGFNFTNVDLEMDNAF